MRQIITGFATTLLISGCSLLPPPAQPDIIPVPILAQLQQPSHIGGAEPKTRQKKHTV